MAIFAHDRQILAVLLNQGGNVVRAHGALPDIDAHLNHVRDKSCRIRVAMMDDQLDAALAVVLVKLLVGLDEELLEGVSGLF